MMGDPRLFVGALCAAVATATAVGMLVRPPRRLAVRVRPYSQLSRSRLGRSFADVQVLVSPHGPAGTFGAVFAPMSRRLASILGKLIDVGDRSSVELRLRQAGFADTSAEQYRMGAAPVE